MMVGGRVSRSSSGGKMSRVLERSKRDFKWQMQDHLNFAICRLPFEIALWCEERG